MTQALYASALLLGATVGATGATMVRPPAATELFYLVAHVDVLPDHAAQARNAILGYVESARREPGALRIDAMQETRRNHFDLVEVWRDEAAYHLHEAGAAALRFRSKVTPWLGSPIDERIGTPVVP